VNGNGGRRRSWATGALLALGGWLVVSPLVLSTTRVTAGVVSAVGSGLALAVLAAWARSARNQIPPLAIAMSFGLWLLVAPSLWEFRDGVDAWELVPIPAWEVTEPTRAAIARAEWNSILAGLLILALAGSVLLAARRRARPVPGAGNEHPPRAEAPSEQR
jgi:SPW repeat